jgi:hypothetical protein
MAATDWNQFGTLVIALAALSGWWLAVRPRASYRGASGMVSFLIVLMAVLLSVLAISGQHGIGGVGPHRAAPSGR